MVITSSKETWPVRCLTVANSGSQEDARAEAEAVVKKISYTADQSVRLLYKKCYKSLCHHARKIINDEKDAEDIVSDAFFELLQQTGRPTIDAMKSQLYAVVDKKCNDHIALKRFIANGVSEFDEVTPADEAEIEAELTAMVCDELHKLPMQRKQILIQLFLQGLTSKQVAEQMKLNKQTVRNQKVRALRVLQEKIKLRFKQEK